VTARPAKPLPTCARPRSCCRRLCAGRCSWTSISGRPSGRRGRRSRCASR
jgi:hypothetical protein